jgi:cytochrome b
MNKVRVYDLPTRVFHWCFAALFVTAYAIANLVDDESARFAWHMLAGMALGVAVLLRVLWGVVGTRHARWSDLSLDPRQLAGYLKGVVAGGGRRWVGHNPASSWAALSMMVLALALGASGLAMANGVAQEWVEEAHELMANVFLAIVLLHVAGLVVHVLRHRDALPLSMLSGRKRDLPVGTRDVPARGVVAVLALALLAGTGVLLLRSYDPAIGTLALFGNTLALGENAAESPAGDGPRDAAGGREDDHERSDD